MCINCSPLLAVKLACQSWALCVLISEMYPYMFCTGVCVNRYITTHITLTDVVRSDIVARQTNGMLSLLPSLFHKSDAAGFALRVWHGKPDRDVTLSRHCLGLLDIKHISLRRNTVLELLQTGPYPR